MNISRALPIEGWMDVPDLEWLAVQASTHHRIAEIGSWQGRSTMALADNAPGVIWAIDHWRGSEEHSSMDWSDPDWVAKIFRTNLQEHIHSGKVKPVRMDSLEFANLWYEQGKVPFDMAFIDAGHDYESVKADIVAWKRLVKRGILCGHDAGHPPIMQATQELLPGVRHEGCIWVVDL